YMYMITAQYADIESQPSNFLFLTHRWRNSVESGESDIPKDWAIDSIWPNPFNSTTQINYSVPISGNIEFSIFDQNGRFIQSLVNGNHQPGRYNVSFSADNLSTGIYFIQMHTPTGNRTGKLMLIK
ncbi:MAG: T9SS type A sorting domain-containing protein, partial [Calditrichaeota bacterium]|nr:T9SS type A sorting domain-containing protein [Calditrichota bacterium]